MTCTAVLPVRSNTGLRSLSNRFPPCEYTIEMNVSMENGSSRENPKPIGYCTNPLALMALACSRTSAQVWGGAPNPACLRMAALYMNAIGSA